MASPLVSVVLAVAGCGGGEAARSVPGAAVASAECGDTSRLAAAPLPGESGVYRAGPVTLAVGEDLAQLHHRPGTRPFAVESIALVTGGRPVSLRVMRSPGVRLAFEFFPGSSSGPAAAVLSHGGAWVRFPACGRDAARFRGGVVFAGHGCARLTVQAAGAAAATMLIPIGDSLRGCPIPRAKVRLSYAWAPFLGLACGRPNSMACERIGVGVAASRPAVLVMVMVAGRLVTLSPPSSHSDLWQGYLQGAGPAHGALRVRPVAGSKLWYGSPEVNPHARVIAFLADGQVATTGDVTVLLHPGFG